MEKFPVSPEDCLVLKAFKDSKSLREAAHLLGCDPAGLARKVQTISQQYGFLQKVNNRWQVTSRGLDLVAWTESSIESQKKILSSKNSLRIASTMWFAEEMLIPNVNSLRNILGKESSVSLSVPQKDFELSLVDGSVDFVVVCHPPEYPEIEHKQIREEAWVLIAPLSWRKKLKFKGEKVFEELKDLPFIRHREMNNDLFLPALPELFESGIIIDNLIGVRSAVSAGLGWSLVPKILVKRHLQENRLMQIPYEVPIHDRKVCVWWLRHRFDIKRQSAKVSSWVRDICSV